MVNKTDGRRRRLSVETRRAELVQVSVELIATRPWDVVTMADVAAAADVSKPLLYHYFSTKTALYAAAIRAAAEELREATRPDPSLPPEQRLHQALLAHVEWVEANALHYRAVLHGGVSADPEVQAIVEESRADVVQRITHSLGHQNSPPALRIALRGWAGFLESACLDWLAAQDLSKPELVRLLAGSLAGAIRAAEI